MLSIFSPSQIPIRNLPIKYILQYTLISQIIIKTKCGIQSYHTNLLLSLKNTPIIR